LERSNAERKPWALDAGSFDSLLTALHGDRATAAAEYERMRQRLIRFFSIQQARSPEELTDTAFNRIARRISEGEEIRNAKQYLSGVARMLLLEDRYQRGKRNMRCAWWRMPGTIRAPIRSCPRHWKRAWRLCRRRVENFCGGITVRKAERGSRRAKSWQTRWGWS
jgi:hypothetical protein